MQWIVFIVLGIAIIIAWNVYSTKKRREHLLSKYGDVEIVENIMKRCFWVGQTAEQLVDSLGSPSDKSVKIMKTKHREIWKYNLTGKNGYGLRITLDDHVVQTLDQK